MYTGNFAERQCFCRGRQTLVKSYEVIGRCLSGPHGHNDAPKRDVEAVSQNYSDPAVNFQPINSSK